MEWTRSNEDLLVRIDPGEEIHVSLQKLADEVGFNAAAITSGIGRTCDNEYGYMNNDGIYIKRELENPSELVSLSGNIARTEDGKRKEGSIKASNINEASNNLSAQKLTVVSIKRGDSLVMYPSSDEVLSESDELCIIGNNNSINKLL